MPTYEIQYYSLFTILVHLALHANIVLIPQGYRGHPCLTLVVDDELVRQPDFVSTHVIGCRRCPSLSRASIQNHARRQMHETREQTIPVVLRNRDGPPNPLSWSKNYDILGVFGSFLLFKKYDLSVIE